MTTARVVFAGGRPLPSTFDNDVRSRTDGVAVPGFTKSVYRYTGYRQPLKSVRHAPWKRDRDDSVVGRAKISRVPACPVPAIHAIMGWPGQI